MLRNEASDDNWGKVRQCYPEHLDQPLEILAEVRGELSGVLPQNSHLSLSKKKSDDLHQFHNDNRFCEAHSLQTMDQRWPVFPGCHRRLKGLPDDTEPACAILTAW